MFRAIKIAECDDKKSKMIYSILMDRRMREKYFYYKGYKGKFCKYFTCDKMIKLNIQILYYIIIFNLLFIDR